MSIRFKDIVLAIGFIIKRKVSLLLREEYEKSQTLIRKAKAKAKAEVEAEAVAEAQVTVPLHASLWR